MAVLEIESSQESSVDLPVAPFPPFKLRSSMVDKDPVIWVHLIEVYIQYVQTLIQLQTPLSVKSEQQLCLFVKTYLHEISTEQGQILSLGLINVQITENLNILRKWILELIQQFGVLKLKLNGEALWDLARIYSNKNASIVRGLTDGSLKPRDKRSINSISLVQKHIEHLIGNSKFDNLDLKILAILLNDKPKTLESNGNAVKSKIVNKKKAKDTVTPFSEKFVTVSWIEMLEKFYAKGEGIFANLCKNIGVLSLISLPIHKLASLATELGATSMHSLSLYPLFKGIITSPSFQKQNPGLEKKLPFLIRRAPAIQVSKTDVDTLIELFPNLTVSYTEKLLRKHKNDVEQVTNLLLENPDAAIERTNNTKRYNGDSKIEVIGKKVISKHTNHVPDEHKNRTLTAALKLMYEADEDERDDTYDEAEAATTTGSTSAATAKLEENERFLWNLFKKDQSVFERTERKSRIRKEMKEQTKWSDEQLEGWARMLQKSPKRVKILEEKYLFRGNKPWNSSFSKPQEFQTNNKDDTSKENREPMEQKEKGSKTKGEEPSKKQQARNEKHKASKANHNRKSGHDKKMSRGFG